MHWISPAVSKSQTSEDNKDSEDNDISKGLEVLVKVEKRCNPKPHRRIVGKKSVPDWDSALRLTKYAIDIFKAAQDHERTIRALRQISKIHKNIKLTSLAVRSLEDAANISKNELNDSQKAADLYMEGYELYMIGGMFERAANSAVKAASVLEDSDTDRALKYYSIACELYQNHAKPLAPSVINSAAKYALRAGCYTDACRFIKMNTEIHAQNFDIQRFSVCLLSLIVTLLKINEIDEAESVLMRVRKCCSEHPHNHPSDNRLQHPCLLSPCVSRLAEDLIISAKQHDYDLWSRCFGTLLKYPLEKEILKLAAVSPFIVFEKYSRAAAINPAAKRRVINNAITLKRNPSVDNFRTQAE